MDTHLADNKNAPPTVSVVLPVFNGGSSVSRALRSVTEQSFVDYQLIVVDDGSTDDTATIVRRHMAADSRIAYYRNETNQGIQYSLNRALALACGRYIARIDADDEWVGRDKLAKQVQFLENNPDHVCVGTGAIVVDEAGKELFRYMKPASDSAIRKSILGSNCFIHGSVLFRRQTALRVGGYGTGPDNEHVEDYDLWLRLGQAGKLANLLEYGLRYRVSDSQISTKHRIVQYRKSFDLSRAYGRHYPHRARAWARNALRLVSYGYLDLKSLRKISSRLTDRGRRSGKGD